MKKIQASILNYLNPKRQAILEELSIDVFKANNKFSVDCKTVFINAVLISSRLNNDDLKLSQKDVAYYFNISEQSIYNYLERHSIRYRESEEYKSLSDYWKDKICRSDSIEDKDHYRNQLKEVAQNNSERECKKMINVLIECGFVIKTDEKISVQEFDSIINE